MDGSALLSLLVQLILAGVFFYVVWWFIGWVGVPEPFNKVIRVVVGLIVLLFLLNVILGFGGTPIVRWR